jgi:hypothetical protein
MNKLEDILELAAGTRKMKGILPIDEYSKRKFSVVYIFNI